MFNNKKLQNNTNTGASQIYFSRSEAGGRMTPRRQEVGVVHDPESCCGCCGCGDTFLTSPTGFTKLGELAIAVVCQFLMLHYGVE